MVPHSIWTLTLVGRLSPHDRQSLRYQERHSVSRHAASLLEAFEAGIASLFREEAAPS